MSWPVLFSYIDPFSGTILLQVIIAGVIGCVAFFRRAIWGFLRFVLRLKRPEEDSPGPEPPA